MIDPRDPAAGPLDTCGCCAGVDPAALRAPGNRPGLRAIAYRVGEHAAFKASLLARLAVAPALRALGTRADDDFAIALLDAWASAADVLTFYQERIANEAYLRTATERVSLVRLAELLGYRPRPGVAASTYLAFTVDDAPGSPRRALIGIGTRVQSVPAPGQQAQTFETVEALEARAEWNAIRPRLTRRQPVTAGVGELLLEGLTTGLAPGDGLLLQPDGTTERVFRRAAEVTAEPGQGWTRVRLEPRPGPSLPAIGILELLPAAPAGPTAREFLGKPSIGSADLHARAAVERFAVRDLMDNLLAIQPPPPKVVVFRARAALFGHNAQPWAALPPDLRTDGLYAHRQNSWSDGTLGAYRASVPQALPDDAIDLDTTYPGLAAGGWVVLQSARVGDPPPLVCRVTRVGDLGRADFGLSARVTRLGLGQPSPGASGPFTIRETTVFARSEELPLARLPVDEPVAGEAVELEGWIDGLSAGQPIAICGELDDVRGVRACESATIERVDQRLDLEGSTTLQLRRGLGRRYVRATVTVQANVALATHGESRAELLGSGDASRPYQRFRLRQLPLTYTSAAAAGGAASSLQVFVNDIRWHEVPALYGHGPLDGVFQVRTDDDGTAVEFGDGHSGARLPTGQANIRASYRQGIGVAGNVQAGQLSVLLTRPLGVRGVSNPEPARGGADPDTPAQLRANAPVSVLTLDRVVSLRDYEDFARAFAGVDRALATWSWLGPSRGVFLTLAGPDGAELPAGSPVLGNLLRALAAAGDPNVPVRAASYRKALFRIAGWVRVEPDRQAPRVLEATEAALRTVFSFAARSFGQPVHRSEVVAAIQGVPGVLAAQLTALHRAEIAPALNARLAPALPSVAADGTVLPAELLTLDPAGARLAVLA